MPALDRKWWTLIAVCTATFMLLLDITVVNVALPDIQRSLHATFSDLQWVVDAYSLTLAAFLLTAGVVGDMFGRRDVFAVGLGVFSISSLVCGLSTTSLMLNLARAAQGVGGAIMFATSLALIAQAFSGKERGTAFGIYGAVIGGAVAVGPLVGGAITSGIGWRWIFFVNVPDRRAGRHHHPHPGGRIEGSQYQARRLDRIRLVLRCAFHAGVRSGARARRRLGKPADHRSVHRSRPPPGHLPRGRVATARPDARPHALQAPGHGRRLPGRVHPGRFDLRPLLVPHALHPGRPGLWTAGRRHPLPAHHHARLHRGPDLRETHRAHPGPVSPGDRRSSSSPSAAC